MTTHQCLPPKQDIDKVSQLSIDLGSSRYSLAMKPETRDAKAGQQITLININGEEVKSKQDITANVILQDAINHEYIPPQDFIFGCQQMQQQNDQQNQQTEQTQQQQLQKQITQNTALLLNWKNYFFESKALIKYPETPTIPSSNNRSARVRVSCIFEGFLYQAVLAFIQKLDKNDTTHIITLLIPSLNTDEHEIFLRSCFESAISQLKNTKIIFNNEEVNVERHTFYFQFKREVIAGVVRAMQLGYIQKNADCQCYLVDMGGYTTDMAAVQLKCDTQEGQAKQIVSQVSDIATNVAGNNIDTLRKTVVQTQLSDIPFHSQSKFHQKIVQLKEKDENFITVAPEDQFFNHMDICCYVVNYIAESLHKIASLIPSMTNTTEDAMLRCKLKAVIPYIKENMIIDPFSESEPISDLKQALEEIIGTTLEPNLQPEKIPITGLQQWVFSNLTLNVKNEIVHSYLMMNQHRQFDSIYIQQRNQLKINLQHLLRGEKNQIHKELQDVHTHYAKTILKILPHLTTLNEFRAFVDEKLRDAKPQDLQNHQLVKIFTHIQNLCQQSVQNFMRLQCKDFMQYFSENEIILINTFNDANIVVCIDKYFQDSFLVPEIQTNQENQNNFDTIKKNNKKITQDQGKSFDSFLQTEQVVNLIAVMKQHITSTKKQFQISLENVDDFLRKFMQKYTIFYIRAKDIFYKIGVIQTLFRDAKFDDFTPLQLIQKLIKYTDCDSSNCKNLEDVLLMCIKQAEEKEMCKKIQTSLIQNIYESNSLIFLKKFIKDSQKEALSTQLIQSINILPNGVIQFILSKEMLYNSKMCILNQVLDEIYMFVNQKDDDQQNQQQATKVDKRKIVILSGGFSQSDIIQDLIDGKSVKWKQLQQNNYIEVNKEEQQQDKKKQDEEQQLYVEIKNAIKDAKRLDECDLSIGGIECQESIDLCAGQQEAVKSLSKQVNMIISKENKVEFIERQQLQSNFFEQNRVNIDQGTSGSQGFYAWANITYQDTIQGSNEILPMKTRQRGFDESHPNKMPSYCLLHLNRLKDLLNQMCPNKYVANSKPLEQFRFCLCNEPLSQSQLVTILSFEPLSEKKRGGIGKLKAVEKQDDVAVIKSWKRNLYETESPQFPEYPLITKKTSIVVNGESVEFTVDIPLSLIYVSHLLFFRQKFQQKYQNPSDFQNTLGVTLTVPCGANPKHLHFIRCCCKQAGWGDNVAFVFEPVSAYIDVRQRNKYLQLQENEQAMKKFNTCLVIDSGGGTTDVALITNCSGTQFDLMSYTSIILAGDTIDKSILDDIEFELDFPLNIMPARTLISLYEQLNNAKMTIKVDLEQGEVQDEQFRFTLELGEASMKYVLERLGCSNKAITEQDVKTVDEHLKKAKKNMRNPQVAGTKLAKENLKAKGEEKGEATFKLSFDVELNRIKMISLKIFEEIVNKIQQFLTHLDMDTTAVGIICVGGVGGSKQFKDYAEQKLTANGSCVFKVDDEVAQTSIARGGIFLEQEKDHVNFRADWVNLVQVKELHNINNIDGLQLKWEFTQYKELNREDRPESKVFMKHGNYDKRCIRVAAGWDGIKIKIICEQNNVEVNQPHKNQNVIRFSTPTLNSLEQMKEDEDRLPLQYAYLVGFYIKEVNAQGNEMVVGARLIKEGDSGSEFKEAFVRVAFGV